MANSKIGQYQLEFRVEGFTSPTRSHLIRQWISVQGNPPAGTLPTAIDVLKLGGATAKLDVVANQAWSYLRLSYGSSLSAVSYTLWKFATENIRDFIAAGTLTTPAGTGAASVIAGQVTLTFRCALGAIAKVVLLESGNTGDTRAALVANPAGSPTQRLAAYLLSTDSPMIGLDNSFPVSPLRDSRGQNEAIWRMVYRSGN